MCSVPTFWIRIKLDIVITNLILTIFFIIYERAMKTKTSILFLVLIAAVAPPPTLRYANADCLYDGDMMLMIGQSVGPSAILECVDATSYRGLDLACGSDGNMIEVETHRDCPTSELVLYSTPYCLQCGMRGERGSAICVASQDSTCPVVEENDS